jgi:diguanylate cyclase (GGDEF)-like protein/PAS domain S-box-containing protein
MILENIKNNFMLINKKNFELQRLQDIISQSVLYTTSDIDAKITSVSKAFEVLTGYTESELIGKSHNLFRNPDTPKAFYEEMWSTLKDNKKFEGELKNYTKNKEVYWTKLTIDPMFDDNHIKVGYVAHRENITNTKQLEYMSTHDTLTNIYNREYFNKTLENKIKSASRYGHQFGLIILDIDHFKKVNDNYGHNVGDTVLIKIAQTLKYNLREDDILARWGGEEFVILLPQSDLNSTFLLAEKLRVIIETSSILHQEKITASFGVGIYANNESTISVFEKIDNALYSAKNKGRNCVVKY